MIANGTRVQFRLEQPEGWPASEHFPSLKFGTVRNSFEGEEGWMGGVDKYVIELDHESGVAFTDESAFVVAKPERIVVEPDGDVAFDVRTPPAGDQILADTTLSDTEAFAAAKVAYAENDGLTDWMGPRPYDAALRIIADLHAAYGENIGISVGRGADSDIVTLHHPAEAGDSGTIDLTMTFSIFGSVHMDWPGGTFDTNSILGPNAYTLGIEAARVWLHEHGHK